MFFVRTASQRDLDKVSRLLTETWHATYDALYGVERVTKISADWHSVAILTKRLAQKGAEMVVADDGKQLGGMGFAALSATRPKAAILHQLYVHPDFQRQGIGRDLFAELETCFPDATVMSLEVDPNNAPALAFYLAHGFEKSGETANCGDGQSGIPAWIMEKKLVG